MTSSSDSAPAVDPASAPAPAPILFRANKKRKVGLRQRAASPDDTAVSSLEASYVTPSKVNEAVVPMTSGAVTVPNADEEAESYIPAAFRQRSRKRLNGVGFSARGITTAAGASADDADILSWTAPSSSSSSRALVPAAASQPDDELIVTKRFAPQTGTAAATVVNKHMYVPLLSFPGRVHRGVPQETVQPATIDQRLIKQGWNT
ncbi:hypothetical protein CTA2_9228 [Colletotrichum tanaceti]|nr:hypothetical protein CTA2_9228 [Colletotrichum tanaceti]